MNAIIIRSVKKRLGFGDLMDAVNAKKRAPQRQSTGQSKEVGLREVWAADDAKKHGPQPNPPFYNS